MSDADLRKKFNTLSENARFHLGPKLFGEKAEYPFYDELKDIRDDARLSVLRATDNLGELESSEANHCVELIKEVFKVELMEDAQNDSVEKKTLETAKSAIKGQLSKVLGSVSEYIRSIVGLEEVARFNDDAKIVAEADDKRKRLHNQLIRNINILNRSLIWWFGKFNPDNLNDAQNELYEKQKGKYISNKIVRINISLNGICPPTADIKNRKVITRWAKKMYKDLASISSLTRTIDLPGN